MRSPHPHTPLSHHRISRRDEPRRLGRACAYPRATPLYASTPLGPEGALLRMELEAADGPPVLTPVRGGTWVTFAGWGGDFSGPALRLFFLAHP